MTTRHTDVMAVINDIYCFWCGRVRDYGCYCYNPDAATLVQRTPHQVAVKTAEAPRTSIEQLRALARSVAATKPPAKRRRRAA